MAHLQDDAVDLHLLILNLEGHVSCRARLQQRRHVLHRGRPGSEAAQQPSIT